MSKCLTITDKGELKERMGWKDAFTNFEPQAIREYFIDG